MTDALIHEQALCEGARVGAGSRVLAFSHLAASTCVGRDCIIGTHVFLDHAVHLGDRVAIGSGAYVGKGIRLEDDVKVGAGATLAHLTEGSGDAGFSPGLVRAGASVGANATILPGVVIGPKARIEPGSVVTRSVPSNAIVAGNPAQIIGYVGTVDNQVDPWASSPSGVHGTSVSGVTIRQMSEVEDLRGNLSVGELGRDVPFEVKRYFLVYDVPNMEIRGEHAHLVCHQFLIAAKGSLRVVVEDGVNREEIVLDKPSLGLHLPPMTWGIQYRYSPDAVLLVLASHHYDPSDYVRDHDRFLAMVRGNA